MKNWTSGVSFLQVLICEVVNPNNAVYLNPYLCLVLGPTTIETKQIDQAERQTSCGASGQAQVVF